MSTEAELLKNKAALLLNCFGYVNAKPEDITPLECGSAYGVYDYILVKFNEYEYRFSFDNDGETKSWKLIVLDNEK